MAPVSMTSFREFWTSLEPSRRMVTWALVDYAKGLALLNRLRCVPDGSGALFDKQRLRKLRLPAEPERSLGRHAGSLLETGRLGFESVLGDTPDATRLIDESIVGRSRFETEGARIVYTVRPVPAGYHDERTTDIRVKNSLLLQQLDRDCHRHTPRLAA